VTRRFQIVAVVLALVFLAGSLSAYATCLKEDAGTMQEHCRPQCPMMNTELSGTAFQAIPQGTSCCNISSGKPVPVADLQQPSNGPSVAIAPTVAELPACTPQAPTAELRDREPSGLSSPPQAVLCIFLV
jgi:hypothetical protein